jgi:hypothetical protein
MAPVTQAALTDLAVQGADEIVAVLVRAIAAGLMGTEHLLDLLEDLWFNDRVMPAFALDAVEARPSGPPRSWRANSADPTSKT